MATYSLSGSGTHALTANTTGLQVTITTPSAIGGLGRSNPVARYDQGLIRFSDGTAYWAPVPVLGGPHFIPAPANATSFGYAMLAGAVVSVVEVIGGTVFFSGGATALSGLSDVTIASPSDGQVLEWVAAASRWENAAPAAPGTGSLHLIQSQTLVANAGSVDFSGIPGTHSHLKLWALCRGTNVSTDVQLGLRFNGDTGGTNYSEAWGYGGQGGASGGTNDAVSYIMVAQIPAASAPANSATPVTIDIPFYAQTTFFHGAVSRAFEFRATSQEFAWQDGGLWRSTAAITSVTLLPNAGQFLAGSMFALYGID